MIRIQLSRVVVAAAATLALAASLAAVSQPVSAQTTGGGSTPPPAAATVTKYSGKVTAVDTKASTITIHSKKDGDMTFTATKDTKVKVEHVASTLGAITVDMIATIRSSDGKTALEISAHAKTTPGAAPNGTANPGTSPTSGTQ